MSAAPDAGVAHLFELLEDWRRLTLAEKEAITSLDWETLRDLQEKKLSIQPRIAEGEAAVFGPKSSTTARRGTEKKRLREYVEALAKLEKQNADLLAKLIASDKQRIENAGQSLRSLRVVQRAYAKAAESFWHSYS